MERFDFIVPSGYFCVTGYHLRHARLHGETLPFDWLDGVTPELFAGFLESRFRDFLELPQLIPEGKKKKETGIIVSACRVGSFLFTTLPVRIRRKNLRE